MGDHFTPRGRDAATTNRPLGRRARRGALVLAAAGLAAFAPGAANAAPVDYAFSDQSDVASSPAYDLTKGTITIDAETGSMRTHLEFLADFDPTSPTVADVSTGAFDRSGKCVVETSPLTVLAGAVSPKLPTRDWYYADARWGVGSPTNLWAYASSGAMKKTIETTINNEPALVGRTPACLVVRTFSADRWLEFWNEVDPAPTSRSTSSSTRRRRTSSTR